MLQAGRGRYCEALEEFGAAEHLGSQLEGSHIYAKLQARDRSSAVQRARKMRLLAVGRTR